MKNFLQSHEHYDAFVVGSGPNGLAAAITLARAGLKVKVFEAYTTVGGGVRSGEATLPGFTHDICSAVHPMAIMSPFFRSLDCLKYGLEWVQPDIALAHPLDGEAAVLLQGRKEGLLSSEKDALVWERIFTGYGKYGMSFFEDMLSPFSLFPRHPFGLASFGLKALLSATAFSEKYFASSRTKALFAGLAGHSFLTLESPLSSAVALALGVASQLGGWPMAKNGSQSIANALQKYLLMLGGEFETSCPIDHVGQLPGGKIIMLDVSAKQIPILCSGKLPGVYLKKIEEYRSGPAVFKLDWALATPIPWIDKECLRAGTLHLGGSFGEIAASEQAVHNGTVSEKPFVLLNQPSLFDASRAPSGQHTVWAYCHVPLASTVDMTEQIENQIERFAPGFKNRILARKTTSPSAFEAYNPSYVGGDISGGSVDWPQIFKRPVHWFSPYHLPIPNVYLCSASTPPGPGVHGMCGFHAAKAALSDHAKKTR